MACVSINTTETYHSQWLPQAPMVSKTSLRDRDLRSPHTKELHLQLPHRTALAFCCQTQKVPEISLWRRNLVRQNRGVNPKASTTQARSWQWVGHGQFFPVVKAIPMQMELSLHHCRLWRLQGHHYELAFLFIMGHFH